MGQINISLFGVQLDLDWAGFITVAGVLSCFITIFAIFFPLLKRREQKELVKAAIKDERKKVFQQAIADVKEGHKKSGDDKDRDVSSRKALAALFKLEQLGGAGIRDIMVQAGYRSPKAPIIYIIARMVLPVIFAVIAGLFVTHTEKELSNNIKMFFILGLALFGFFLPKILVKNNAQKRQEEIKQAFPDALDMMLICVQGGISLEASINRITDAVTDHSLILAEELGILSAELAMLNDRRRAFTGFAVRCGVPAVKTFINAMTQAEQYGTSVSQALRVMAEELRDMRLNEAEAKAAALPPKLTVPMILFFLPPLFVIILGPAIIKAMQTFGGN